jgi:glucokinase
VLEGRTEAVNLAWPVDARRVAAALGLERVGLVNDLEANAWGISALRPEDLSILNEGEPDPSGNAAVISAGTGLGEAALFWDGERYEVVGSEGGHADFAPRTELEVGLLRFLWREHRHVSYERVCSGMGLVNIYRYLRSIATEPEPEWLSRKLADEEDAPATISHAALEGTDPVCRDALDTMISIYGAEAGNLALRVVATGGVYVGGGIAPRILPRLREGGFMHAFVEKGRLAKLLADVPVKVILNDKTALYGAAVYAQRR